MDYAFECNHFGRLQYRALWAAALLDLSPLGDIITTVDGN